MSTDRNIFLELVKSLIKEFNEYELTSQLLATLIAYTGMSLIPDDNITEGIKSSMEELEKRLVVECLAVATKLIVPDAEIDKMGDDYYSYRKILELIKNTNSKNN